MDSLRLLILALKYNFDSQKSNPMNLIAGTFGMIINNAIVLWGLWAMLFDGKPDGKHLTMYFLCLNSIVTISWGSILFFLGGLRNLALHVEEGTLEPMLSTPRHPLLLVAISESSTPALGDILQRLCNLFAIFYLAGAMLALRSFLLVFVSIIGFMGLFILAGAIPFFLKRGNSFAQLFIECNLSFSFYPSGKIFSDYGKILLYLIPAAFTGILPMAAIETASWVNAIIAIIAIIGAIIFFLLSISVFMKGLNNYQSSSYVAARA